MKIKCYKFFLLTILWLSITFYVSPPFALMTYGHGRQKPELAYIAQTAIYLLKSDNRSVKLTHKYDVPSGNLLWSPNGKMIVYVCLDHLEDICGVNTDGTQELKLTNNDGFELDPSVSPDGRKIVFESNPNLSGDTDIIIMDIYGTEKKNLTQGKVKSPHIPIWSPDGKNIAFGSDDDIYIISADGTNIKNLTDKSGENYGYSWSPDSENILFLSEREKKIEIYSIDIDGSNLTQLTNNKVDETSAIWSPDGNYIAFTRKQGFYFQSLYVMKSDGSNPIQVNDSEHADSPTWSADSKYLAFISKEPDTREDIYRADIICLLGESKCNKPLVNLTNTPDIKESNPQWSPVQFAPDSN